MNREKKIRRTAGLLAVLLAGTAQGVRAQDAMVSKIRAKYEGAVANYDGKTLRIQRDEPLKIAIGYNPWDNEVEVSDSFGVFQDAALQNPVGSCYFEWDMDSGILTITPPLYGTAEVDGAYDVDLGDLNGTYLYGDEISAWGNLAQYYLATYVDTQTGELLDEPVVTVLKNQTEIAQAPQVRFDQTEIGEARLSWREVPGAEEYLVFTLRKFPDAMGFDNYMDVIARTTDTEWVCEAEVSVSELDERVQTGRINEYFVQYYQAEDTPSLTEDEEFMESLDEETRAYFLESEEIAYDEYYEEYFGVIAVREGGSSPIGNLLPAKQLCHVLPNQIAYNSSEDLTGVQGTMNLPSVMGVTMCDGSTGWKIIDYDFDDIVKEENWYEITARAQGTPFSWPVHVYEPNWDALDEELENIRARQEELKNKAGLVDAALTFEDGQGTENAAETEIARETEDTAEASENTIETETAAESAAQPETESITETEAAQSGMTGKVTANSAISEYMARKMLETSEAIDLSAFPEAADMNVVTDAFFEARYQNPRILGVRGASMDEQTQTLCVEYDDDVQTTAAKQEELAAKADKVLAEIITEGMTDVEKELAINKYLCDTIVYDDAALENAAQYEYLHVDPQYNDSFTAYGALVKGVCVCAGYSAAFKLLADGADLDSIVVTGYLDGSLSHAWNKVKIDGQWSIVDTTNNDNDEIPNALLNLSDEAADATLSEDQRFVLDERVEDYTTGSDEKEYYHMIESYYGEDEAAEALAKRLQDGGTAMVRTAYQLDDETFVKIAQKAANGSGKDLTGYYWLGVISLSERE